MNILVLNASPRRNGTISQAASRFMQGSSMRTSEGKCNLGPVRGPYRQMFMAQL